MGIPSQLLGLASNTIKTGARSSVDSFLQRAAQGDIAGAASSLIGLPGQLINTIGAYGQAEPGDALRGMNARSDAQQNWCWYCLMPSLTDANAMSLGDFGVSSAALSSARPQVSLPWYYVPRATLPMRSIETESIKRSGSQIILPVGYSTGTLSIDAYLDSSNLAMAYFKAWGAAVLGARDPSRWSNRGTWGFPADYKKDINFYVLSVTKKLLLNIKYVGCWPSEATAMELVSEGGGALTHGVTLQTEDVEIIVLNDKGVLDTLANTALGYGLSSLAGTSRSLLSSLVGG